MDTVEKVLFEQAYLPAFMRKCAAYGVEFPDEATLNEALETTKMILEASDDQKGGVVKEAAQALRMQLKPQAQVEVQEPVEDEIVKAASNDEAFQLAALNAALGK